MAVTSRWQIEWRGLLLGYPATGLAITDLDGWLSRPDARSQPLDRPGRHGAYPSPLLLSSRIVEATFEAARSVPKDLVALDALRDVTVAGLDDDPEPLTVWCGTAAPQLVFGRVLRSAIPTDQEWSVGYERATVQWECTDPLRYSVDQHEQSIGLPTAGAGGLTWPLQWPLYWGTGASGGSMVVTNAGNCDTWPLLRITGPVTGPVITFPDQGLSIVFNPAYTIPAGMVVEIDPDNGTVVIGDARVNQRTQVVTAQWATLPKGDSRILFSSQGSYDPNAQLSVLWRDAWQ